MGTHKTTDTMSTAELASSYAALILADDGVDITADKLNTLIKAAGVDDVEPIWTSLFAKALEGKDVKDLLLRRRRRRRKRRRRSRTRTWVSVSSTKRAAPITLLPPHHLRNSISCILPWLASHTRAACYHVVLVMKC